MIQVVKTVLMRRNLSLSIYFLFLIIIFLYTYKMHKIKSNLQNLSVLLWRTLLNFIFFHLQYFFFFFSVRFGIWNKMSQFVV